MTERKPFMLRLSPATMAALRGWAGDDLRSLNGQVEYLLRRALREAGRLPTPVDPREDGLSISDDAAATGTAGDVSDPAAVPTLQMRSEPQ